MGMILLGIRQKQACASVPLGPVPVWPVIEPAPQVPWETTVLSVIATGKQRNLFGGCIGQLGAESISKFPPTRTRFRYGSEGPDLIRWPRLSAMLASESYR